MKELIIFSWDQHDYVGRWYPKQPPALPGESHEAYTNRLLGIGGTRPYDHLRNRQCSIGYHLECSDWQNTGQCQCPHHLYLEYAEDFADEWNRRYPVGTRVQLPFNPEEAPTLTTGTARVVLEPALRQYGYGWAKIPLAGFPGLVDIAWIRPATPEVTNA